MIRSPFRPRFSPAARGETPRQHRERRGALLAALALATLASASGALGRERPGESAGGGRGRGGNPNFSQLRELAGLIRPGMGMGGLFGGRGGGGGQGDFVDPGSYTVTVKIGDRTMSRALVVEHAADMAAGGPPSP